MCRWGCETLDTTYMCKWCGIRFCNECLRGDFMAPGLKMSEPDKCRQCFQTRCRGPRVEYVPGSKSSTDKDKKRGRGKSARKAGSSKSRGKSAGSSKRGKSGKKKKR